MVLRVTLHQANKTELASYFDPMEGREKQKNSHCSTKPQRNATYVGIAALFEVVADIGRLLGARVLCESSQRHHCVCVCVCVCLCQEMVMVGVFLW